MIQESNAKHLPVLHLKYVYTPISINRHKPQSPDYQLSSSAISFSISSFNETTSLNCSSVKFNPLFPGSNYPIHQLCPTKPQGRSYLSVLVVIFPNANICFALEFRDSQSALIPQFPASSAILLDESGAGFLNPQQSRLGGKRLRAQSLCLLPRNQNLLLHCPRIIRHMMETMYGLGALFGWHGCLSES
jgi:hypothetical protein